MRRNVLLLTAVVLAAVMLSGCTLLPWNWGKVTVTYNFDENVKENFVLKDKDLKQLVKKSTALHEFTFAFAEEYEIEEDAYEATITAGGDDVEAKTSVTEDGLKVSITSIGKKDVKVTIGLVVESEES